MATVALVGCDSQEKKQQREAESRIAQMDDRLAQIEVKLLLGKPLPADYPVAQICQDSHEINFSSQRIDQLCAGR